LLLFRSDNLTIIIRAGGPRAHFTLYRRPRGATVPSRLTVSYPRVNTSATFPCALCPLTPRPPGLNFI